jgi:hypothetical protein
MSKEQDQALKRVADKFWEDLENQPAWDKESVSLLRKAHEGSIEDQKQYLFELQVDMMIHKLEEEL